MESGYPSLVIEKILKITMEMQNFAYLSVNPKGQLCHQGGDIHSLGLPTWSLNDNIIEEALFLSTYLPMSQDYEYIPSFNIKNEIVVDIHLFKENDIVWVILVDKTKEIEWQKQARQKSNELHLLQQQVKNNQQLSSQSQRELGEFEFFEALNLLAFSVNSTGEFQLLKPFSDEFYSIYPELSDNENPIKPQQKFPFIENFLIDANHIWDKDTDSQIASGPWIESSKNKDEIILEAKAINWKGHRLFFIEIKDILYQQHQNFLQIGRENKLKKIQLEKELSKQSAEIHYLATHDSLTNLPNRYSLYNKLNAVIYNASRNKTQFALLFLDLDEFKAINDNFGHKSGDELLCTIADRLQLVLRENDFAARIGGDEFCIIIDDAHDEFLAAHIAERCLEVIEKPIDIFENKIRPKVSIGIAVFPNDGGNIEQIISASDIAMYAAKNTGKHKYAFYTQEMTVLAAKRILLEKELRKALESNEFELYYQPQVSIKTGKMISVEALIRWHHPTRGLVMPGEFIHIIEKIGLMTDLGEWVIKNACDQAIKWQKAGIDPFRIAVNISGSHFEQGGIVNSVKSVLQTTGLEAKYLELEVTEEVAQTTEKSIKTLKDLKKLGISIAIDDFGTGYSSLGSLKHLPVDCLKLDRMFIKDALSNANDSAIISMVIAMGKALGLSVLVEGVETLEQIQYLKKEGCYHIQGYYFSKPTTAEKINELASISFYNDID